MSTPAWRKSSRSGTGTSGGENCVEVAAFPAAVGIRDSKNPDAGHLTVSVTDFGRLVDRIRSGELAL
jgi:hypothetical protein